MCIRDRYYTIAKEQGKLCPDPIVAKADAAKVYANVTEVSPNPVSYTHLDVYKRQSLYR